VEGTVNDAQRLERVRRWFDVIEAELRQLLIDNHVFWEIQDVVRRNPQFANIPGLVTQWMASCFIQAAVSAVRRQVKLDKDSISLRRLLVELQTYPQLITRQLYVGYFAKAEPWLKEAGPREFDAWSGGGDQLDPSVVQADVSRLVAAAAPIEAYGDRRVAHYDQRGLAGPAPTFKELTDCLQMLDDTFKKYHVLLRGSSLHSVLPTIIPDWQAIFRFPWMN
jgi:hypothetical protein